MTIIRTDKGERISVTEEPRWNEFHKRFYVAGNRWIKSRQSWSKTTLIHNFVEYEPETITIRDDLNEALDEFESQCSQGSRAREEKNGRRGAT